jgi:hypothetical protein
MDRRLRSLALAAFAAALIAGPAVAQRAVPAPSFGTFEPSLLEAIARIEAAAPAFDPRLECAPADDPPRSAARKPREGVIQLNSEDDDGVHYARGSTLYFHVFINHQGGTWSDAERDTAAAKAARSKMFYMAHAPAAANLSFDNFGGTGYYYYETNTRPYTIATDGMSVSIVEDVIASFGFTDDDGDGSLQDEFALFWQDELGGWDNVAVVYQPADRTGRARASYGYSRIYGYTDDGSNTWRHELGHLFGSCDEYEEDGFCNGSGIDCGLCQGWYLTVTANNGNCEKAACPGTPVACVMNNNVDAVCDFTNTHWGWNDDDSNGLLDNAWRQTTAGTYVGIRDMFHNGYYYSNSTTSGYVARQSWNSWSVFGMRNPAGSNYALRMYLDNNHNYQATLSYTVKPVEFIVGDYNHNNLGNEHLITQLVLGAQNNYNITFESGTGTLYPDGEGSGTQTWNDYNVVRVYEVPLFAGETISFTLDILSGSLDMGMALFRSNNGPYYASRASAVATDDAGGVGATESFSYTVPADDVYGLVVWSNNEMDGTFDIQIGPAPLTLLEDQDVLSGIALRLYEFDPVPGYWGVVGSRPDDDTNVDLRLFDDADYVTEREGSSYGVGSVDFIAIDYNHAGSALDYLRVSRESGAGNHRTEFEQGTDIITGAESFIWDDYDVVEAWDVTLDGTIPYFFRQYNSGATLDGALYMMRSTVGDYWQSRNDLEAFSNQPPASSGEWFSYTAPVDDVYGLVMLANNGVTATSASVWVGPKVNWGDDLRFTRSDEVTFGTATPATGVWNVAGLRSTGTDATSLVLYGDDAYTSSELKASDPLAGPVRFVVGDWNHNPAGNMYPRTQRTSGVGAVDMEWEGGTEALSYDENNQLVTDQAWPSTDVAEIWDLFLPASRQVAVMVEVLSGDLDLGMELFDSNSAEYFARRGQGVVRTDAGGVGETELMTYTTGASSDFYGLVIYNKTDNSGTYRIRIWNPQNVAVDGPGAPQELALAASPNPARGDVGIRMSLPRESDVALELFDVQGRVVRTLARGRMPAGEHPFKWDGRDENGAAVGAGIYLARLKSGGEERRLKLVRTN